VSGAGPLAGRRIVVTRSRAQARLFREWLEADGAEVVEVPVIRISPPDDHGPVDAAIDRLAQYDWVVFTSQNAVAAFLDRALARAAGTADFQRLRIAAIGPATAHALRARGLRPSLEPQRFVAEALVEAFAAEVAAGAAGGDLRGTRILLPRAAEARSVLPDGLKALGADVDIVPVYRVEGERDHDPEVWRRLSGGADAVTFTSPSTVRNFVELLGAETSRLVGHALVACIGPVTAEAARSCGLRVGLVADTYTVRGLVDALRRRLGHAASAV
jgi:uroporphyrinogen III methyltransferase / synthase